MIRIRDRQYGLSTILHALAPLGYEVGREMSLRSVRFLVPKSWGPSWIQNFADADGGGREILGWKMKLVGVWLALVLAGRCFRRRAWQYAPHPNCYRQGSARSRTSSLFHHYVSTKPTTVHEFDSQLSAWIARKPLCIASGSLTHGQWSDFGVTRLRRPQPPHLAPCCIASALQCGV